MNEQLRKEYKERAPKAVDEFFNNTFAALKKDGVDPKIIAIHKEFFTAKLAMRKLSRMLGNDPIGAIALKTISDAVVDLTGIAVLSIYKEDQKKVDEFLNQHDHIWLEYSVSIQALVAMVAGIKKSS